VKYNRGNYKKINTEKADDKKSSYFILDLLEVQVLLRE